MTCAEALEWVHGSQFTGIKLGLENTHALLAALGNPERQLLFLHVAGTNGKGSVCAMLDAALRAAGHRCGLYTSPHLVDFRERIRVDGQMISEESVAAGLSRLRENSERLGIGATFFEFGTVLAIEHFAREGCSVAVLETGMGGRLDATNVVEPLVSVLTPIGMDHAEWLGDTLGKIAFEKAGIIKTGIPVVSAPQAPEAAAVFRSAAAERGSRLQFISEPWEGTVALSGEHQKWNAALALAAIRASGLRCNDSEFAQGMARVAWPGRFQRVGEGIVVDGSHNPHAVEALVAAWRQAFGGERPVVVFGSLDDKDSAGMVQQLESIAAEFVFVPVQSPRGKNPNLLTSAKPHRVASDLREGLDVARSARGPVLVCGSLYLAGEALALLGATESITQSA
ncbi:MAG: bifunctional folylpolyglutamate synthase/dihydrofolate synthase [Terrimicrobiaceae bacterium]